MLRMIDVTGQRLDDYTAVLPRGHFDVEHAVAAVEPICRAVAEEGETALRRFAEQFDHVVPEQLRVPEEALYRALDDLEPGLRAAIEESIRRRREVARGIETEEAFREIEVAPGARVANRLVPVGRVGLYVPGGLAPLASTVLMNVVPAQVAGVQSIAVATPPQAEFGGLPHPTILAVCRLLGVTEVYAVGGAQAVAMFAYGVPGLCRRADMVTGPGNIYVVAAKRLLRGRIGIDAEAGPTEILVLADDRANPAYVAADLISQAEHDPMAGAVLVTDSSALLTRVEEELADQVERLATRDRLKVSLTGEQSGVVLVADMDQGIDVVNDYAPEHLEIQTVDAAALAQRVRSAGAVFVGSHSPVPLGDYSAGSTHVLPTGGAAHFSSGLTTRSFLKAMHIIDYSAQALDAIGDAVEQFAHAEHLPGHAEAIAVRTGREVE
ncbi:MULTISPECIES: histidinol dehydrogenase [Propionibacterium]|uniref:histidinol dehydrogenase n=1 Tax=Propionibacterium TaxID=1743 RepID=UPI0005A5CD2F|nr:histidinol dehydrogenase [Propionibacterium freudenreichii]MDK9295277.1 histidinol dehydrogenase [Propionibacterium freudenreichii]MDK9330785.1 histidinol dehydrogenase [Propionibacterium freudenreichii]MDK9360646.1 histidinol dehydrogenase [Propionibacterium freudenreichii]MDK9638570.1 histidinol dehydrogenase [Propionibacterium freudenreichii]MDK9660449.1 histidinol dehydrogenase [Propionibacterium freudenreichii]